MTIDWDLMLSVLVGAVVPGLGWLGHTKGWWGTMAREVEPIAEPMVKDLQQVLDTGKLDVENQDYKIALDDLKKQAIESSIRFLVQIGAEASGKELGKLNKYDLGYIVEFAKDHIQPSWRADVTPEAVATAIKDVQDLTAELKKLQSA